MKRKGVEGVRDMPGRDSQTGGVQDGGETKICGMGGDGEERRWKKIDKGGEYSGEKKEGMRGKRLRWK